VCVQAHIFGFKNSQRTEEDTPPPIQRSSSSSFRAAYHFAVLLEIFLPGEDLATLETCKPLAALLMLGLHVFQKLAPVIKPLITLEALFTELKVR